MRFYFIKKKFNDQTVKLMVLSFGKTVINPPASLYNFSGKQVILR